MAELKHKFNLKAMQPFFIHAVICCFSFAILNKMIAKKVIRYYSECGRGFWKKQQAISHDENCKCWKNPKFKSCLSCKHKCIIKDSNGMENEPQFLQTWDMNNCKHSESGVPVHKDFEHIRKYCQFHEAR